MAYRKNICYMLLRVACYPYNAIVYIHSRFDKKLIGACFKNILKEAILLVPEVDICVYNKSLTFYGL